MLRACLVSGSRLLVAIAFASVGCIEELNLDAPPAVPGTPGGPVEAQFDPTNPIPVLTLVPTPTVLAQNPDGTLNQEIVSPQACELPTDAQCLAFVEGWPTNLPVTLFFSDEVDLNTVAEGIELYEVSAAGAFSQVQFNPEATRQTERVPPGPDLTIDPSADPDACKTAFGYEDSDIPTGFDLELTPATPLRPGTQYIVLVKSSEQGGLRDMRGRPIEPSALFFVLNDDEPPVADDGEVTSALLRAQLQGAVLADPAFGGTLYEDLSDEQRTMVDQAVIALGQQTAPLYDVFNGIILAADANGVISDRSEVVFANTWNTAGPPRPTVAFDPQAGVLPFPNSELFLDVINDEGDLRVNLPIVEGSPIPPEVVPGLNKLDGFSLRTPPAGGLPETGPTMLFDMLGPVDIDTLDDAIVMFRLDDAGAPVESIDLILTTTTGTNIIVQPLRPLSERTTYVVGVTNALKRADGSDFGTNLTFELLKTPAPLITDGTVLPAIAPALQCVPLTAGGDSLGSPEQTAALATGLEGLRAVWQGAFTALEGQGIPRTDVLLAWTYTTQSITKTVDEIKEDIFAGTFDPAGPRVVPTGIGAVGTASVAALIGVVDNLCLPLCESGELPTVATDACVDGMGNAAPAVAADPVCQQVVGIVASELGSAELFFMRSSKFTAGSPFTDGTFDDALRDNPTPIDIGVWLVLPSAPPPPAGYPVTIFQHGLGQSKEDGFLIANSLATVGWATVMIDMDLHGDRASDLTTSVVVPGLGATEIPCEPFIDPVGVTCNPATGMCTGGCDGVQDASGTGFLSANSAGNRDNYRQVNVDQLTLLYTLQQEASATGAWPQLDPTRIGYVGQSLGAITGANLLSHIDDESLDVAVLNVGGGDLIIQALNSVVSIPLYVQLNALGFCDYVVENDPTSGCQITPDFLAFLALTDWNLQASDPIQTASAAVSRFGVDNILMQVSVPDPVVPNASSEALAARYGFSTSDPDGNYQAYDFTSVPASMVGGGCHGFILSPTCGECLTESLCNTAGGQLQAVTFIATNGGIITDQVPASFGGLDCTNPCGN